MSISQETNENLLAFCNGEQFATIYADPPWRFQNRTGKVAPENKKLNRYETMDLEAIKAMPVSEIAAKKVTCISGCRMPFFLKDWKL